MKYLFPIPFLLLFCSCGFLHKAKKQSLSLNTEQTAEVKDSLQSTKKDSLTIRESNSQSVNTVEYEFFPDTVAKNDIAATNKYLGDSEPLIVKIPINAADYFNFPVNQKIKKIKVSTTATNNNSEQVKIATEDVVKVSAQKAKQTTDLKASNVQIKNSFNWTGLYFVLTAFLVISWLCWYSTGQNPLKWWFLIFRRKKSEENE